MHGLVNRSLQSFVCDTYGPQTWDQVVRQAQLPVSDFDSLAQYEDAVTARAIAAASAVLNKPRSAMLEDLGTYLVAHPRREAVRRLLRFSGDTFVAFLMGLEDLPDRVRLALPDLDLPDLSLKQHGSAAFTLTVRAAQDGAGHVVAGLLRAMADDYGALVMMEVDPIGPGTDALHLTVHDLRFARGRRFDLAQAAV